MIERKGRGRRRVKRFLAWILVVGMAVMIAVVTGGCTVKKMSTEKIRDIAFTVVKEEEIPEEFQAEIQKKKEQPFKLTYADQGMLYIAQGYGKRQTSGYSIEVNACYETENAVYVQTSFLGPSKEEQIVEADTFPYIVIKLEWIDKHVVFQ